MHDVTATCSSATIICMTADHSNIIKGVKGNCNFKWNIVTAQSAADKASAYAIMHSGVELVRVLRGGGGGGGGV